jgi:Protein of unknown function (DUF2809)
MATTQNPDVRRRPVYAALALLIPPLGLAVRSTAEHLPRFVASYAPDTLWALMVFVVVACLAPRLLTWQVALLALGFSYLIECSQLHHAP